jgi:sugar lactone lactonase YvrE
MSEFELVWDSRCGVAESPVWDASTRRLLFCDIPGKRINALSVDDGARTSWDFPEVVGSFGLCLSGRFVVALRHRVVLFDPRTGEIVNLTDPVDEPPTNRLNDGKVGPDGCFWVGSMDERPQREKRGVLYRVTPDGRIERKSDGYAVSNGLAWSPDAGTMYHSDSTAGTIECWDFDVRSGGLSNHRVVATLTSEDGRPDGAAVDAEGVYWSAGPSAGCINRFSPQGKLLTKLAFPVPGPTMPCFAERHIYVTSLREGRPAEILARNPTMGGLFRTDAPVLGAPVAAFADA